MLTILDRLVIWACCAVQIASRPTDAAGVVAMLAAVTVSALNGYLRSLSFCLVSTGLYIAACLISPGFCLYIPVVYYDIFGYRLSWSVLAVALALAVCLSQLPTGLAAAVMGLVVVAWVLKSRTTAVELGRTELMHLRDSSYELATALTQKNKELLEKQDYEIRLATLNERGRIAREIHDHVGHLLSRSILQVGALLVTQRDTRMRDDLSMIRNTLSQAMDSIRSSVHNLHDESFDLRTQVEALTRDFTFCPIQLNYRLESEPNRDIAYCFIAVIKEGLSNIIRHSNATQVTLALMEHPALYQLVLQDNGTTHHSDYQWGATGEGEGLGLQSMEDRVSALGGQFLVERHSGFRLFVSVPKGEQRSESPNSR